MTVQFEVAQIIVLVMAIATIPPVSVNLDLLVRIVH